ncbi:hypothetical protein K0504_10435 [Neiella marina]|uniref:Uncharacterized protein n=1 Tax=Neiella holothuriorum TaxID=2870530 RepID=A0ABS7EHS8_9GAMM|nr:hypothetical protein [Neiella holothuriorum]MBW8191453.1 hypothetical protein [Neiella holothuriorum]
MSTRNSLFKPSFAVLLPLCFICLSLEFNSMLWEFGYVFYGNGETLVSTLMWLLITMILTYLFIYSFIKFTQFSAVTTTQTYCASLSFVLIGSLSVCLFGQTPLNLMEQSVALLFLNLLFLILSALFTFECFANADLTYAKAEWRGLVFAVSCSLVMSLSNLMTSAHWSTVMQSMTSFIDADPDLFVVNFHDVNQWLIKQFFINDSVVIDDVLPQLFVVLVAGMLSLITIKRGHQSRGWRPCCFLVPINYFKRPSATVRLVVGAGFMPERYRG